MWLACREERNTGYTAEDWVCAFWGMYMAGALEGQEYIPFPVADPPLYKADASFLTAAEREAAAAEAKRKQEEEEARLKQEQEAKDQEKDDLKDDQKDTDPGDGSSGGGTSGTGNLVIRPSQ